MAFALPVSPYTIFAALSAVVTGSLAVRLSGRHATESEPDAAATEPYPDLVRPFVLTLLVFTGSAIGYAVVIANGTDTVGFGWGFPSAFLIAVPWSVFALRYAGREHLLTRQRVAAFSLGAIVLTALSSVSFAAGLSVDALPDLVVPVFAFLLLFFPAVVFVVSGFVLVSSYRHGKYTLASGVIVVLPIAAILLAGQLNNPGLPTWSATMLTGGHVAAAATFVVSVTRYDVLSERPGTGTVGERRVVEEMDEAVFVVGSRGVIARANEAAKRLFGADIEGAQFTDVLDCSVAELADQGTVERWTERSRLRFDPRVSELTDSRDRTLGHAVTLLDVTEREIRQQRIQVLNRILRHNLRNNIDVIMARAEAGIESEDTVETHLETVIDVATDLEELSVDARRIEQVINDDEGSRGAVDVAATVETAVERVTDDRDVQATVSTGLAESTVRTSERLLVFAVTNLVENAIEHGDTPEPRVEVRASVTEAAVEILVVDDGPGIPASERQVLQAGEEAPLAHASGLGLWSTKWAVETMGGELSFGESDLGGAAVHITLPSAANDG
jgi:signal transduction histidine kinase